MRASLPSMEPMFAFLAARPNASISSFSRRAQDELTSSGAYDQMRAYCFLSFLPLASLVSCQTISTIGSLFFDGFCVSSTALAKYRPTGACSPPLSILLVSPWTLMTLAIFLSLPYLVVVRRRRRRGVVVFLGLLECSTMSRSLGIVGFSIRYLLAANDPGPWRVSNWVLA